MKKRERGVRISRRVGIGMEIRHLRSFVAAARLGKFARAAETLGYTQSTITTHIHALESETDVSLFDRIGRSVRLTDEGERFLPYAEKIVALAEEASATMARDAAPCGPLVVGAAETLVSHRLTPMLQSFCALHPDVRLSLCYGACNAFRDALRANTMDIAFIMDSQVSDDDLIATPLWPEPMEFAAAPSHPLAAKKMILPEDLAGQTLILSEGGCYYRAYLEEALRALGFSPRTILSIGQIEPILQLVRNGQGVTYLPRAPLERDALNGSVRLLPWAGRTMPITAFLVRHRDKHPSAAMRAFAQMAEALIPRPESIEAGAS